MPGLKDYLHKFSHLRTDRTGGWTAATQGRAPHKPILLFSVLDLFAQSRNTANLIVNGLGKALVVIPTLG